MKAGALSYMPAYTRDMRTVQPTGDRSDHVLQALGFAARAAARAARDTVELPDTVQQASLGMLVALRTFDETKGASFCSWARIEIACSCRHWKARSHVVRPPDNHDVRRVARVRGTDRPETVEALARSANITTERAAELWPTFAATVESLPVEGWPTWIGDALPAEEAALPDPILSGRIAAAMDLLTPIQRETLLGRLQDEPETKPAIAARLGVTVRSVERAEESGLKVLRKALSKTWEEYREATA